MLHWMKTLLAQSSGSWASGWGSLVHPKLSWPNVSVPTEWGGVAMNRTRLIVGLPPVAAYDILAPETVAIFVPGAAVVSGRGTRAADLVIRAQAGTSKTWSDRQLVRRLATDVAERAQPAAEQLVPMLIYIQQLSRNLRKLCTDLCEVREPNVTVRSASGFEGKVWE